MLPEPPFYTGGNRLFCKLIQSKFVAYFFLHASVCTVRSFLIDFLQHSVIAFLIRSSLRLIQLIEIR